MNNQPSCFEIFLLLSLAYYDTTICFIRASARRGRAAAQALQLRVVLPVPKLSSLFIIPHSSLSLLAAPTVSSPFPHSESQKDTCFKNFLKSVYLLRTLHVSLLPTCTCETLDYYYEASESLPRLHNFSDFATALACTLCRTLHVSLLPTCTCETLDYY
ncbi:unnamed protein product [Vicia faba]|uniref:Secreted protein n=1 Tax=Vicia faba TaxID=3906 RepID=A0AAV1ARH7_VICFA|nr:unnamed protein product [Vicia faba]